MCAVGWTHLICVFFAIKLGKMLGYVQMLELDEVIVFRCEETEQNWQSSRLTCWWMVQKYVLVVCWVVADWIIECSGVLAASDSCQVLTDDSVMWLCYAACLWPHRTALNHLITHVHNFLTLVIAREMWQCRSSIFSSVTVEHYS